MFGIDDGPLLAIPFDFDMSGFVNTPYATPDTGLGIDNVRQRLASYMDVYVTISDSQGVEQEILNRCIEKTGAG
jgi:hypothetical protein